MGSDTGATPRQGPGVPALFACTVDESGGVAADLAKLAGDVPDALVCSGSVDCYAVGYHGLAGWVSVPEWGDMAILCPQCAGDCLVYPEGREGGEMRLLRDIAWMGELQKGGTE